MAADARIDVVIEGDNRPLKQTLSDTTSAIDKEAKNWDNATKQSTNSMAGSFESSLKRIAGAISAAAIAKKLFDFGKAAIDAASDLEEVQNVVDVTFGDGAKQIDAWAKTAINQFGLTETKAKQFASTLGAMMKSAGMSGDEIIEMSENLSGLAADMASFYNLDFDTAFQKIRSGISGETEPLKQLGINMSVANLEAFALQQGLKKTFNEMSQGEQTMLRYQYIMQATADAQGDFARTSDGYANGLRLLQSNFESIKTTIGTALIPVLATATASINDFLTSLTQSKPRTVLDEFNDIEIDTQSKIQKIQDTANEARTLIGVLNELDNTDATKAMESLAKGANTLNANSPATWSSLLTSLQKVDGLENIFKDTKAGDNVKALADALSGASPDTTKAEAWQTFLGALSDNVDVLTTLTGTSADETKKWIEDIAAAANEIDPNDADAWNKLLTSFVTGLPGLADTEGGKEFFDALAQNFLAMGNESEQAKQGLTALGFSTDEINTKQKEWLDVCKRLVQTIPGLSEIIDTQTGEVKGGTDEIAKYVTAWENAEKRITLIQAQEARRRAVSEKYNELPGLEVDMMVAERRIREQKEKLDALAEKYGFGKDGYTIIHRMNLTGGAAILTAEEKEWNEAVQTLGKLEGAYQDATDEYNRQKKAQEEALAIIEEGNKAIEEQYGAMDSLAESTDNASSSLRQFTDEEEQAALKAVENAESALKSLKDYIDSTYKSTRSSVVSALGGFSRMVTPAEEARNKVKDLKEELSKLGKQTDKNKKEWESLQSQISSLENTAPSIQNITQALMSQSKYLEEYMNNLARMKELGYSDQVIAMVSDGSAQSADYAAALAKGKRKLDGTVSDEVQQVNNLVAEVNKKTDELSSALTENKLAVDEQAQELVTTWAEAVTELDKYSDAKQNISNTMQGIIDGISSNADAVQQQVNSIISMINTLSTMTYGMNISGITPTSFYSSYKPTSTVINTKLFVDGKQMADTVSEHQANELVTLDRSGFN